MSKKANLMFELKILLILLLLVGFVAFINFLFTGSFVFGESKESFDISITKNECFNETTQVTLESDIVSYTNESFIYPIAPIEQVSTRDIIKIKYPNICYSNEITDRIYAISNFDYNSEYQGIFSSYYKVECKYISDYFRPIYFGRENSYSVFVGSLIDNNTHLRIEGEIVKNLETSKQNLTITVILKTVFRNITYETITVTKCENKSVDEIELPNNVMQCDLAYELCMKDGYALKYHEEYLNESVDEANQYIQNCRNKYCSVSNNNFTISNKNLTIEWLNSNAVCLECEEGVGSMCDINLDNGNVVGCACNDGKCNHWKIGDYFVEVEK